jgi:hypothetical protein
MGVWCKVITKLDGIRVTKTVHIKGAEYIGVVLINTPEVEDEVEEVEDVYMYLNRGCFTIV